MSSYARRSSIDWGRAPCGARRPGWCSTMRHGTVCWNASPNLAAEGRVSSVQAIDRAFAVLDALGDGPLGVTEVADAHRACPSPRPRGCSPHWPARAPSSRCPAARTTDSARGSWRWPPDSPLARSLAALARPVLVDLAASWARRSGCPCRTATSSITSTRSTRAHPVHVRDWTGARAPLHAVSSGQVLLAFRPPAAIERYLAGPLERFTARTLAEPDAVRERLQSIRRKGFTCGDRGVRPGDLVGRGTDRRWLWRGRSAAVHVHGPSYRFPGAGRETELGQAVVAAAARIGAELRES